MLLTRGGRTGRWWGLVLLVLAVAFGSVTGVVAVQVYRSLTVTPGERVALIETTACGHSSGTSGVGVVIAPDRVLTAAHTVSGAGEVAVVPAAQSSGTTVGTVVGYDQRSDLALLAVSGIAGGDIELAEVEAGDEVQLRGTSPGVILAQVTKRVEVRIEGVRSSERGSRFGFLIDTPVELGDSGAPVFDGDDQLVGVVFGRSDRGTFVVRAEEIEAILAQPETEWVCDPEVHELVER